MKRLGLTFVAAFCLAAMTFAAGNQPTTAKWEGNINVNKLSQYLNLNSVQSEEVEEVEWSTPAAGGRPVMKPTGKKEIIEADMVLLAMGFLKPEQPEYPENVFIAGDAATGASLVVRAMAEGRRVAKLIYDL